MIMIKEIFDALGIEDSNNGAFIGGSDFQPSGHESVITSYNPTTGERLAEVKSCTLEDYHTIIEKSGDAFKKWRMLPAPQRGLIIRDMANILR